jgi:para-nitrobenzyl esterase
MRRLLLAVCSIAGLLIRLDAQNLQVEQGLLSGTTGKNADVRVYRGIPYATPPIGDLRWKPPQPAAHWQGVRAATEPPNACWQTQYPAGSIYQTKLPALSEDCLYLNVWTAAKSAKERRPVMVWIHGGGFTRGYGGSNAYDGEALARKGVVLVTINYRLGIFGFFAHPELTAESEHHASGNYALLDQVAALQWVQKNIAAFGGDPNRVTIFGESAGSWAVNCLMASPLAKGLFHRAIGESGASFTPMRSLIAAEKAGESLAAKIGANDGLKTLRSKSAEELQKAGYEQTVRPIVDGWVVPQDIAAVFAAGKQNDVPLIAGFNADEGTSLAPLASMKVTSFTDGIHQRYGDLAEQFLKVYPANTDDEALTAFHAAYRDQVFGWEMRTWVRLSTRTGHNKAYLYYFTHRPPGPQSSRLRAFHGSEIPYVFGNFFWPFPWEEADKKLSDTVSSYWVNFATTGNPNGPGLPNWLSYSLADDASIELGDQISSPAKINKAGLDFFDTYYHALMTKAATPLGAAR